MRKQDNLEKDEIRELIQNEINDAKEFKIEKQNKAEKIVKSNIKKKIKEKIYI